MPFISAETALQATFGGTHPDRVHALRHRLAEHAKNRKGRLEVIRPDPDAIGVQAEMATTWWIVAVSGLAAGAHSVVYGKRKAPWFRSTA